MAENEPSERSYLLTETKPRYAFESSITRQRERKLRQFQCCLCSVFLCIILVCLVAIISYSISQNYNPRNETIIITFNTTNTTDDDAFVNPLNSGLIVLSNRYPLHRSNNDTSYKELDYVEDVWYNTSILAGIAAYEQQIEQEAFVPELLLNTASYKHQRIVATTNRAAELSQLGAIEQFASKHYFNITSSNVTKLCFKSTSGHDQLDAPCTLSILPGNCSLCRYRSYDGSCNNIRQAATAGVAYTPFRRLLPPNYEDGISLPRIAKDGGALPSARTVSLSVHRPIYRADPQFTVMLAVWGQFVDHDMTATALTQRVDKDRFSTISCCPIAERKNRHPACFPVQLDAGDPYYQRYNVTCMEFLRSAPAATCCLGAREQMNQVSAYIDGSVMYGTDKTTSAKLRSFVGGELAMYRTEDNRTLLPISVDRNDGCNRREENSKGRYCFITGDGRSNENLHLTTMHLLWVRHHNSLAKELHEVNPAWTDEKLFQETRRIVAAQMQHITYNEFLPIIFGKETMRSYDLEPQSTGYYEGYDDTIDASIANSFAASAFRFAHTLLPTLMAFIASENGTAEYVQLHRMLFDPYRLYVRGEMDRAIRGAVRTPIQASDPYFSPEVQRHLFADDGQASLTVPKTCGLDLVSLNIQRGRDHGLAPYVEWRRFCGLPTVVTFADLAGDIDRESLDRISTIYRDVADIDLYTGALSERPLAGTLLGPTFTCLLLDQFVRTKRGDRHWYETAAARLRFTAGQLAQLRGAGTSLAAIVCRHADDVARIPRAVMERIDAVRNPLVPCGQLPALDLSEWRAVESRRVSVTRAGMKVRVIGPN